jgi:hypothetical protein
MIAAPAAITISVRELDELDSAPVLVVRVVLVAVVGVSALGEASSPNAWLPPMPEAAIAPVGEAA